MVAKRRDLGTKQNLPRSEAAASVAGLLEQMQAGLLAAARQRTRENTVLANSLYEVTAEKGGGKFVMAHIKDDPECDARIKQFKASVRCIPLQDEHDGAGKCIVTGERVEKRSVIAKAY